MTTGTQPRHHLSAERVRVSWGPSAGWVVRLLGAACLATSAYTHLHLASGYDFGPAITLGQLFLVQGVISTLLVLWLLLADSWPAWLIATAVMATSAVAVLISSRAQISAVGPFPGIYEPVWYPEKVISAASEVAFLALVLARAALTWSRVRTSDDSPRHPSPPEPA